MITLLERSAPGPTEKGKMKNVTTKVWKKTHRLAKVIASILDITMVELFHEAIVKYGEDKRVMDLLLKQLDEEEE